MNKKTRNKRKKKKIIGLFGITGVTMLALIVGTYAWFIGLSSVSVSEFDIGVSTAKNLYLSLDGSHWTESLSITEAGVTHTGDSSAATEAYNGNTNKWVDSDGLIPMSTDGAIDSTYSRLKLYTKSSITATKGGYRLMSARVTNYGDGIAEQKGYVAFDLFIKNGSGTDYTAAYNSADDEAVYLTTNSTVVAVPEGDADDYGLANSVRVAFVQIGRTSITTTDATTIQGITCSGSGTTVTGLCTNVTPTIWEPNDAKHNSNLVTYFNNVCKKKSVSGGVVTYSTTDKCTPAAGDTDLTTTSPVSTYVVNSAISSSDKVDVYDGLNDYEIPEGYGLSLLDTFTDTEKALTDSDRPAFMYLAANSITKIRVYIYLEGQDIDNYDLVSNGKKIRIQFGFTKDQYDQSAAS